MGMSFRVAVSGAVVAPSCNESGAGWFADFSSRGRCDSSERVFVESDGDVVIPRDVPPCNESAAGRSADLSFESSSISSETGALTVQGDVIGAGSDGSASDPPLNESGAGDFADL
jgi:hypothetical protein